MVAVLLPDTHLKAPEDNGSRNPFNVVYTVSNTYKQIRTINLCK